MNIGIDVRMIRHTGIGTYVGGLVQGLQKLPIPKAWKLSLFGNPKHVPQCAEFAQKKFGSSIYSIQEQLFYPSKLAQCQLWHAPHYNIPLMRGNTKVIVTIHDIIHWIFRKEFFSPLKGFYAGKMLQKAVLHSDHIISVSEKTKRDLVEHFDADPDKISVIYEGVSEKFHPVTAREQIEAVKTKYKIARPYFLYVGLLKPHKNILWLVRLFRQLQSAGQIDADLVLVGKKDKRYPAEFKELSNLKSGKGIHWLSYVEFEELKTLYSGALALVHPSLYEGFGLTLLEAMACGTPVIACRSGSIPEVAGEAACLVEACSPKAMTDALVRFAKFPNMREEYVRKGFQQAGRFSWTQMAKQTAEIYDKVLSQ